MSINPHSFYFLFFFSQLAHSLKEVSSAEDGNKSDSFEEPSSDESEFDFDDDTSNQSFVKSQTSQTVSEKSNTFDNKIAATVTTTSTTTTTTTTAADEIASTTAVATEVIVAAEDDENECDSKFIEPCAVSTVETYDNYLGDESGKCPKKNLNI